jgi:hypothetical protein
MEQLLTDLLIDNEYQIDNTLEWKEQLVQYIMRYRRIIGIIILIILLLIMKFCKWEYKNVGDVSKQNGGGSNAAMVAEPAAADSNNAQNLGKARSKSAKFMNIATGGKYSAMRTAGMSRFASGLELTRQGGQYVADKFKQFASWLYEILFAIAISIAICMIVMPSIAFFALGLICYFLLRKKISTMKAF